MTSLIRDTELPIKCTGCCLICNDIRLTIDESGKPGIENACPTCAADIVAAFASPLVRPPGYNDALSRAAELLTKARFPLVCGLADQSVETQQAAIQLAKEFSAVVDWTIGNSATAIHAAVQDTGMVSCTFQEIRERSDLVVFWSTDVQQSHPLFVERFVADTSQVDITWSRQKQLLAIRQLRQASCSDDEVNELKQQLDRADYPVIVFDESLAGQIGDAGILSLFRFVRAQNDRNHCRLVHLADRCNAAGIESTLASMTAAPFGVAFRDGVPVFRGREFTVEALLRKKLVDAVLLVGSPEQLPSDLLADDLPVIWIQDSGNQEFRQAKLVIPSSRWGLGCDGVGIRDDGVPVERQATLACDLPGGVEILDSIRQRL